MPTGVNLGDPFWQPRRNSADENRAISRYPEIEELLAAIDRTLVNLGRTDEAPASLGDGGNFFNLLAEVGGEWICAKLSRVSTASLWFIVAVYLEARQEPRHWYELNDDYAQHIMRVLSLDQRPDDDTLLSPRALVLAYLLDHGGWAPAWFRPLAEA